MKRYIISGIGIAFAALLVLAGIKALQIHTLMAASWPAQVETVATAAAHEETWQDSLSAVGSISAVQGVTVAPEIAGTVKEILFESGATVAKGDPLVKLDASSEVAQLKAAEAQLDWAKVSAERTRQLRTDKTVSQSELDQAEAALKQAQANVDAISATIDKKNIRAPFAGKLGIRLVNLGEQLDVGKAIVSLQSLSPVYADFSLPQQDLAKLKTALAVKVTTDTYPGRTFDGTVTAINPDLDATTRSVRVQATLENPDQRLRPGMFVRAEVILPDGQNVLVIPRTAILRAPFGDSVYVVDAQVANGKTNLVAQQKFIATGRMHGDFISVETGLKAGDRVVSAGVFKLHNGASIEVNNEDVPKPSLSPNPPNS